MKLRFLASLLIFVSAYFPLALIFVIQDLDKATYCPEHPWMSAAILVCVGLSVIVVLTAARVFKGGHSVKVVKASNKSGEMFTYAIPYMLSVGKFNFGDWQALAGIIIFLGLMFLLMYRTQSVFVNPVLALAGYGMYDCVFREGTTESQALVISKVEFQVGEICTVRRLSPFLFFLTSNLSRTDDVDQSK